MRSKENPQDGSKKRSQGDSDASWKDNLSGSQEVRRQHRHSHQEDTGDGGPEAPINTKRKFTQLWEDF